MRPRSNLTDVSVWFWPILTAVVGVARGAAGRVTPRFELVPTGACMTTVVTLVALVSPRGALLSLPFALLSIADTIRIRVGPAGFEGSDLALTLLRLSSLAAVLWLAGAVRSHVSRPTRENETVVSGGADSDIGDRRRAEEALRESEAFLRFSQKVGQVGSWDWDPRTDRVVWSDEMCRIHGIDPEAFSGTLEGALAFLVRGEPDRRREVRAKLLAVAGTRTRDYEIQRADGCTRMLWTQFLVSHDDRGRPIRVVGITQDVTDRLETDEAFRRQTQILERVFANLDEGVVVTDPDGRLALWNDVIDSTFGRLRPGVTRSEWAARFAARRMDGTPFAGDELPLTRALGGETLRDEPARVTTASGATERVFSASAAPVKNEDGASLGAVSIFHDITEERRARAALERSREQLRRLAARSRDVREQERTAVAREIHDELGQALTSLRMDLGWLHAETSADRLDVADRLRAMTALVDATVHTVRRIASSLRPAMLDDLGLVAAMEWQVREFEQRSGLRCETVFPTTDVPIAPDRATAVFRIFQEALTNVARHADATQVRVRLAVNDGGVALEVSDGGKGISDDALLRVDALGLIGMRERAETLGGVWRIRGAPGAGTTVTLTLPPPHAGAPA